MGNVTVKKIIKDGEIDKAKFEKGTLAFLLKESNTSDKQEQSEDFFWFSEVVKKKRDGRYYGGDNISKSDKRSQSTYYNLLNDICEMVECDIRKCSYVNLNPLGGGKRQSKEYENNVEKYFPDTKEKIQDLEPKAIICCGTYETFLDHIPDNEKVEPIKGKGTIIKINGNKIMVIKAKYPADTHVSNETIKKQVADEYKRLSAFVQQLI